MSEEHKTLGQVCFEGLWEARNAATGQYKMKWADMPADARPWWEAAAAAVVLAEQGAPTCPSCGKPGRYVCGACIEAAIRRRNLPDQSPGQRAYEMWQRFTWDNQKNPTLKWDQLTMRDHANWEVIADPDDSPRRAGGHGTTDTRVYNAVSAIVANMLTCMPSEDRTVSDTMARHISQAVGAGVAEGLKAWEVNR